MPMSDQLRKKAKKRITFWLTPTMVSEIKANAKSLGISESHYAEIVFGEAAVAAIINEQQGENDEKI